MPNKGQKRELSQDLREVVADNVQRLMESSADLKTARAVGTRSGVGRRTVDRLLNKKTAANLDTLEAIATAFNVGAWELVANRPERGVLQRIMAMPPAPDAKLGAGWTRPDRRPLATIKEGPVSERPKIASKDRKKLRR